MKFTISAFIYLSLFMSSAAWAQSVPLEKSLVRALMLGCLPNAMGLLDFSPENEETLNAGDLTTKANIPSELIARLAIKDSPITHTAVSKSAPSKILLVSSPKFHVCTIGVGDTPAKELRAALIAELEKKGAPWKHINSEVKNGIAMQTYKWHREPGPNVLANISGPEEVKNNGSGMQLMVRIALVKD
jgi:hypothetical protein